MTVQTEITKSPKYAGNGATTEFAFSFKITLEDQLLVTEFDSAGATTELTLNSDYTVTFDQETESGTVTLTNPLASGRSLTIVRNTDLLQLSDYQNQQAFFPEEHEKSFDKIHQILQEQGNEISNSLKFPKSEEIDGTLGDASERAGNYLIFDSNGQPAYADVSFEGTTHKTYGNLATALADSALQVGDRGTVAGVGDFEIVAAGTSTNYLDSANGELKPLVASPELYGASTSNADNSQALNAMFDDFSSVGLFDFGGKIYPVQNTVQTKVDSNAVSIKNGGIDGSGTFSGTSVLSVSGIALAALPALSVAASKGGNSVTFASAHDLSFGDTFIIANQADSSWSGFRTNYKAGEYCQVASVSGNAVNLTSPLYDDYATSVNTYKQESKAVILQDFKVAGGANSENALSINLATEVVTKGCEFTHKNNAAVSLVNCTNINMSDRKIVNEGDGGDDYGVLVSNSQHATIKAGYIYGRRHAVTIGGGVGAGVVPCRDIKTVDSTLKNDMASGVHNADFHGHAEDCFYSGCVIYGGAAWQGRDNGYKDCVIYNNLEGVCVIASEVLDGRHYAENCHLKTFVDPSAFTRGVVDIGGNADAITVNTIADVDLVMKDCVVESQSLGATTSLMMARNRGTANKINIEIDGLKIKANNFGQVLFMDNVSGTAASDRIIIDNIITNLTGKLLGNISGGFETKPMRLQKESGGQEVTTSTSSSTVTGTAVVLKWVYPKIPVIQVSRTARGYAGNRIGIPYADPVSATGFTPAVSTDDITNFSSAVTMTINWKAEISEV